METNNLTFNGTETIEQFKASQLIKLIEVKKNPKTGKLFFTFGSKTGAVSSKGIPSKRPVISNVTGADGENFYLLHEQGEGAPTLASF